MKPDSCIVFDTSAIIQARLGHHRYMKRFLTTVTSVHASLFVGGRYDSWSLYGESPRRPEEFVGHRVDPPFASERPLLFLALPVAPGEPSIEAYRQGWLQWVHDNEDVEYRFFVHVFENHSEWVLDQQRRYNNDMVTLDMHCSEVRGCERDPHRSGVSYISWYMRGNLLNRAMMRWALENRRSMAYYVRVDTDTFVCVEALRRQAKLWPRRLFVAAAFHCGWMTRTDEAFVVVSRDVAEFYVRHVGSMIRVFDKRAPFDDAFGRFLLQSYVRMEDDKERIQTYPAFIQRSATDSAFDIPPQFRSFVQVRSFDEERVLRQEQSTIEGLCATYLAVHPIKQASFLQRMRETIDNGTAPILRPRRRLVGLNCSKVTAPNGLTRPGLVPGFTTARRASWWASAADRDRMTFQPTY